MLLLIADTSVVTASGNRADGNTNGPNPAQRYNLSTGYWQQLALNRVGDSTSTPTEALSLHRRSKRTVSWDSMKWAFEPQADGTYRIVNQWDTQSGYLTRVHAQDGSSTVELRAEANTSAQRWHVATTRRGRVRISSAEQEDEYLVARVSRRSDDHNTSWHHPHQRQPRKTVQLMSVPHPGRATAWRLHGTDNLPVFQALDSKGRVLLEYDLDNGLPTAALLGDIDRLSDAVEVRIIQGSQVDRFNIDELYAAAFVLPVAEQQGAPQQVVQQLSELGVLEPSSVQASERQTMAADLNAWPLTLHSEPSAGLDLELFSGDTVTVGLPEAGGGYAAQQLSEAAVQYRPTDTSHAFVGMATASNGLRAAIVINDSSAPDTYRFPIDLPTGHRLDPDTDGTIAIRTAAGDRIAVIDTPWAIDADGRRLPTRYEIDGTTLVQFVDHRGAAYPVVADPAVEADCGIINCTIRFDRTITGQLAAGDLVREQIISLLCSPLSGQAETLCRAALGVAPISLITGPAAEFFADGDCLAIRVPVFATSRVEGGTLNCELDPPPTTSPPTTAPPTTPSPTTSPPTTSQPTTAPPTTSPPTTSPPTTPPPTTSPTTSPPTTPPPTTSPPTTSPPTTSPSTTTPTTGPSTTVPSTTVPVTTPPTLPPAVDSVEGSVELMEDDLGLTAEESAQLANVISADPVLAQQFISSSNSLLAVAPLAPAAGIFGAIAGAAGVILTVLLGVLLIVVLIIVLYLILTTLFERVGDRTQEEVDQQFNDIVQRLEQQESGTGPQGTVLPRPVPLPVPDNNTRSRRCQEVAGATGLGEVSGQHACETLPIYFVGELDLQEAARLRSDAITRWPQWGRQNRLFPVPDPQRTWLRADPALPFPPVPDRGWPDGATEVARQGCLQAFRPGTAGDGLFECDEFPNASMQAWGPARPEKPQAALRFVTTDENQDERRWIQQFYAECGLGNGDPFLVVPLVGAGPGSSGGFTDFYCGFDPEG